MNAPNESQRKFSLAELFDDLPAIHIVDVGASLREEPPPYKQLVEAGKGRVTGFEPNPAEFQVLQQTKASSATYYPYAVGDGRDAILHICQNPGMTSLLKPDAEILSHFHGFAEWGAVQSRQPVATRRLDDVVEVRDMDYLKMDVQGSELSILQGATLKLKDTLVVNIEVQFIPFYRDQPLFAELDLELRKAGFFLHFLTPFAIRAFKPVVVNNDIYGGLNQVLWSDAIYVRKFTEFSHLSCEGLLKTALILHDMYGSFDLAALALDYADKKAGTTRQAQYLARLMG